MPRTLSSNVTTGILGGAKPCWLIEWDSDVATYRFGSFTFVDGGNTYSGSRILADDNGRISGIGKIKQSINLDNGGNVEDITDWTLRLNNADGYHDTIASENFEGRRIELRLIFPDISGALWLNAAPIFRGFTNGAPSWDFEEIVIHATRGWFERYRDLPTKQMTKARFPELPESLEGEFIGMIWGDFWLGGTSTGINRRAIAFSGLASSPYHHRDYVRMRQIKRIAGLVSTGQLAIGHFALAEHELLNNRCADDAERVFRFDTDLQAFISIEMDDQTGAFIGYDNPAGIGTLVNDQRAGFDQNRLFKLSGGYEWIYLIPNYNVDLSDSANVLNPTYCIDEDPSNRTTINADNKNAVYIIDPISVSTGLFLSSLKIYLERDGDETVDVTVATLDGGNTTTQTVSTFGSTVSISLSGFTGDPIASGFKITINSNLVGGAFNNVYIKHLHIAIYRVVNIGTDSDELQLFQTVRGRMFHSYIDVANHSNSKNAGDLVQHPAYIIESVLHDDLHLTPANLSRAVDFDGSNDALYVKHSESLALTADMSIDLWVYLDNQTSRGIVRKAAVLASTVPAPFDYWLDANGKPVLSRGNGSTYVDVTATNAVGTAAWHHIGVRMSGTSVKHYLDGSANGTGTLSTTITDVGGDMIIARNCRAADYFDGKMDELHLWNRSLSDAEFTALYNSGNGRYVAEGETGLVACYHFDEGVGLEFKDWSGNGNDAGTQSPFIPAWAAGKVNTSQEYDELSFDTVANVRSLAKFARQLTEQTNARDLIREICNEFGITYYERPNGLCVVQQIEKTADSVATLDRSSMARRGNADSFRVSRVADQSIYTEYFLYYRLNYGSDAHDAVVFVKSASSPVFNARFTNLSSGGSTYWTVCHDAFVQFRSRRVWTLRSNWIRDQATAEMVIKQAIERHTFRAYVCEFDAPLSLLALELLDEKKITHDLLPSPVNSTARFRLTMQEIDPATDTIRHSFRQVENVVNAIEVVLDSVSGIDDSYISKNNNTTNYGSSNTLRSQSDDTGTFYRRMLIKFDLTSIPGGATILSATLRMYCNVASNEQQDLCSKSGHDGLIHGVLEAHSITAAWVESEVTWDKRNASTNWTTAGGDYDATVVDTGITHVQFSWAEWDVKAIIDAQIAGTSYGILLKFPVDSGDVDRINDFWSSEYTTASLQPQLIVVYEP